jgi:hypothetical protein
VLAVLSKFPELLPVTPAPTATNSFIAAVPDTTAAAEGAESHAGQAHACEEVVRNGCDLETNAASTSCTRIMRNDSNSSGNHGSDDARADGPDAVPGGAGVETPTPCDGGCDGDSDDSEGDDVDWEGQVEVNDAGGWDDDHGGDGDNYNFPGELANVLPPLVISSSRQSPAVVAGLSPSCWWDASRAWWRSMRCRLQHLWWGGGGGCDQHHRHDHQHQHSDSSCFEDCHCHHGSKINWEARHPYHHGHHKHGSSRHSGHHGHGKGGRDPAAFCQPPVVILQTLSSMYDKFGDLNDFAIAYQFYADKGEVDRASDAAKDCDQGWAELRSWLKVWPAESHGPLCAIS